MSESPRLSFLSLFVDDLAQAASRYHALLGVAPVEPGAELPNPHPFAAAGPVVFELGPVKLALYQCDQSSTHVGDVGIGITIPGPAASMAQRARQLGGQPFFGPSPMPGGDDRELMVMVTADRHFFEVLGKPG